MPQKQSPCNDCPNKGCGKFHSQCDKYLAYTAELEIERQKRVLKCKCFVEKNYIGRKYLK